MKKKKMKNDIMNENKEEHEKILRMKIRKTNMKNNITNENEEEKYEK